MSQAGQYTSGGVSGPILTLTGNVGGPVPPTAGDIQVIGAGGVTVTGNPGTSTLTITVPTSVTSLTGTANQVLVNGGVGPATGAVTLTIPGTFIAPGSIASTTTITAATGLTVTLNDLTMTAGNINLPYTNAAGTEGLITAGGVPLVSTLGTGNIFTGVNVANLTFNTGAAVSNAIFGSIAFQAVTTGSTNSGLGYGVLSGCTSGSGNVAIGTNAGQNITTTSNNIFISNAGVLADAGKIRIGTNGTHTSTFIQGIANVAVANKEFVTINTATGEMGSDSGSVGGAETFNTDSGAATAAANAITIAGTANQISTAGAASTVTLSVPNTFIAPGSIASTTTNTAGTDLISTAGNLKLPTTTSLVGQIQSNSNIVAQWYGTGNVFLGAPNNAAGNFTLTVGNAINNTAIGSNTLAALTTGAYNCALGRGSLVACTQGNRNSTNGFNGLASLTTGNYNTTVGANALVNLLTGSSNICIGTDDGAGTGHSGQAYTGAESNNILIGSAGVIGDANVIRIGASGAGAGQQSTCYIAGIEGVDVGSVAEVVTIDNGQLGSAVITAGANITVTPGANTITIASTGGTGFTWTVTTIDAALVAGNGYIANKAGLLTMTLPGTAAVGDTFEITGINTAVGWRIAQNANQMIHYGTSTTSTGVGGYLEATAIRDSIRFMCVVADLEFQVLSSIGNITVV